MKRMVFLFAVLLCGVSLCGCGRNTAYTIAIVVPAGTTEATYCYSDEEISPLRRTITLSEGEGIPETALVLRSADGNQDITHGPVYFGSGLPTELTAENGAWYKIGLLMTNPTDTDKVVYVKATDVTVRIE